MARPTVPATSPSLDLTMGDTRCVRVRTPNPLRGYRGCSICRLKARFDPEKGSGARAGKSADTATIEERASQARGEARNAGLRIFSNDRLVPPARTMPQSCFSLMVASPTASSRLSFFVAALLDTTCIRHHAILERI